jgi:hypothetical protein
VVLVAIHEWAQKHSADKGKIAALAPMPSARVRALNGWAGVRRERATGEVAQERAGGFAECRVHAGGLHVGLCVAPSRSLPPGCGDRGLR